MNTVFFPEKYLPVVAAPSLSLFSYYSLEEVYLLILLYTCHVQAKTHLAPPPPPLLAKVMRMHVHSITDDDHDVAVN